MTIVEGPGQVLEVAIGSAEPITVWTIRTREERTRYLGLGHSDIPQPRRVVSTAPVLSRTGRRSAAAAPAPLRRCSRAGASQHSGCAAVGHAAAGGGSGSRTAWRS